MNSLPCTGIREQPCLNLETLRLRESISRWFLAVFSVDTARSGRRLQSRGRNVTEPMEDAARRCLVARARFVDALQFHYSNVDSGVLNDQGIFEAVLELNRLESDCVFRSVTENL